MNTPFPWTNASAWPRAQLAPALAAVLCVCGAFAPGAVAAEETETAPAATTANAAPASETAIAAHTNSLPEATQPATSVAGTNAAPTESAPKKGGAGKAAAGSATDFSAFKLVYERNIFDPNRHPAGVAPRNIVKATKAIKVDKFSLVGTMLTDGKIVAFFSGTDSSYQATLGVKKSIAGFEIDEIRYDGVKLCRSNQVYNLSFENQMRREDGGEWRLADGSAADSSGSGRSASRVSSRSNGRSSRSSFGGMDEGSSMGPPGGGMDLMGPPGGGAEMMGPPGGGEDNAPQPAAASSAPAEDKADAKSSADEVLKRLMEKRRKE